MCQYWKKLHTCTHLSDRPYIEMCRAGFLSNTVCRDISEDQAPRHSHFPCWTCIKQAARAEAQENAAQTHALAAAAESACNQAIKYRGEMEKRAREARQKAERERAAGHGLVIERDTEVQRVNEGAPWVLAEAGSGRKKKGRGVVPDGPASPARPSAGLMGAARKSGGKENGKTSWMDEKGAEMSGRAGTWGPKRILSRKEGAAGALGIRTDIAVDSK